MKLAYVAGSAIAVAIVAILMSLVLGSGGKSDPRDSRGVAATSPAGVPRALFPAEPSTSATQLATDINRAQRVIDHPFSSSRELASAALFQQLATGELKRRAPQDRRATLTALSTQAAAATRANLNAAGALSGLAVPPQPLPHWEILSPPPPNTLLGYFREAQARFGVAWPYLAAIEFVETRFGRVHGLSSAGAQGPMQFLPAAWALYGRGGNINNQHDAILAAARLLIAKGAPRDMAGALYHYNPSHDYVNAVEDYARMMRSDPQAYYGYYSWQVLYQSTGGLVILPVGYPTLRPVPVS